MTDPAVSFEPHRRRLLGLAYRMLGSLSVVAPESTRLGPTSTDVGLITADPALFVRPTPRAWQARCREHRRKVRGIPTLSKAHGVVELDVARADVDRDGVRRRARARAVSRTHRSLRARSSRAPAQPLSDRACVDAMPHAHDLRLRAASSASSHARASRALADHVEHVEDGTRAHRRGRGPFSAPIAATIALTTSEPVEVTTRAVNVDVFIRDRRRNTNIHRAHARTPAPAPCPTAFVSGNRLRVTTVAVEPLAADGLVPRADAWQTRGSRRSSRRRSARWNWSDLR